MDDCNCFSITENNFTYEVKSYLNDVYITAKSDIDKRVWKIMLTDETEIGIENPLVYKILEDYSKGVEDIKKYFIVEFPTVPKDKTGDLLIVITSISFYKSQEKHYQIHLKLDDIDDVIRLEERIVELRHVCDNHSETIAEYRSVLANKNQEIKELTNKSIAQQAILDTFVHNFEVLEKKYGFRFQPLFSNSGDTDDENDNNSSDSSNDSNNIAVEGEFIDEYITSDECHSFMSSSVIERIKVCGARLDVLEAEILSMKELNDILGEKVTTMDEETKRNITSLLEKVEKNSNYINDFSEETESELGDLKDDLSDIKSNLETVQKAGIYSKKHIESIHSRLNHISDLVSSGYANTSRKLKEEYLSKSPSNSWNEVLLNRK